MKETLLSQSDLMLLARSVHNCEQSPVQILRAHGIEVLRASIKRCRAVNYKWLLADLEAAHAENSQREERRAAISDAVYRQQSLVPVVRRFGAGPVAADISWLRGNSDATRSRGYPDPAIAFAIAAELAIEFVLETSTV